MIYDCDHETDVCDHRSSSMFVTDA